MPSCDFLTKNHYIKELIRYLGAPLCFNAKDIGNKVGISRLLYLLENSCLFHIKEEILGAAKKGAKTKNAQEKLFAWHAMRGRTNFAKAAI